MADLLPNQPTAKCKLPPLDVLRALFTDPARLKPGQTTAEVTEGAAEQFSVLAKSLRDRGVPSERAAHFLMRLLFCLFSEDIGLLPGKLFSRLVESNLPRPDDFSKKLRQLFAAMSGEHGSFGEHDIAYFNGGLFSDDEAYDLTRDDLAVLALASHLDWSSIEPAIFGTLFERSLDPDKRSQLGAHYTSESDIRLIVEPVLMEPLRRRWDEVRQKAEALVEKSKEAQSNEARRKPFHEGESFQGDGLQAVRNADLKGRGFSRAVQGPTNTGALAPEGMSRRPSKSQQKAAQTKALRKLSDLLHGFADELSKVRVLDPACGSGNFL